MDNGPDWTEQFIAMVETKPILYDRNIAEFSDKDLKNEAWTDVCEVTTEHWHELTDEERALKVNDARQRWKNLRSCFTRELREQRKRSWAPGMKKRRKYVYFDQLMFLLPTLEEKANSNESEVEPYSSHSVTQDETLERGTGSLDADGNAEESIQPYYERPRLNTIIRPKKKKPVGVNSAKKQEEIDEDKLFLLSLVPAMKRLKEDQKYELKIELLKVMSRFHGISQQQVYNC